MPAAGLVRVEHVRVYIAIARGGRTGRIVGRKGRRNGEHGIVKAKQRSYLRFLKADIVARYLDRVVAGVGRVEVAGRVERQALGVVQP
mgnify:CR=1 FL=1